MGPEPLSRSLEQLAAGPGVKTLNDLVERTDGRGIFLVMILLCLPFVSPVALPGLSNMVGLAILLVARRLYLGQPARLPEFIGKREWTAARMQKVIRGSVWLLSRLERVVKPRRAEWLSRRWAVRLNAFALGFMALLLALPIPPVIPFSNSVPGYAIILLSASMMEKDGATIWLAYAACAAALAYFILFTGVIVRLWVTYEERIGTFLRGLL